MEQSTMPSTRHRQSGLSLIPKRISGATHVVASPVAAHALRATPTYGSSQETAPLTAEPLRGRIKETMVGVGLLPEGVFGAERGVTSDVISSASVFGSEALDRGFLRETVKFGTPASSAPVRPRPLDEQEPAVSAVAPRRISDQPVAAARAARVVPRASSPSAEARPVVEAPRAIDEARRAEARTSIEAPRAATEAPRAAGAAPEAPRRAPAAPRSPTERAEPAHRAEPERPRSASPAAPVANAPAARLFRTAAVDARRADVLAPELAANVKGKSWSLLLLILSLVGMCFAGAALATIEVTAEAQGALRAPNGLRPVASVLAGAVTEVQVQSGDAVEQGQVIARLEATELRAGLVARERELALVQEDVARSERHDAQLEAESGRALSRRRAALRERIEVNAERRDQRQVRDQSVAVLVRDGGASRAEGLAAKEALQDATEQVSSLSNELALLDLEIADRARQAQERDSARKSQLGRAEAGLAEARTLLAATEIRAPATGRVESLLVTPGVVVAAGGVLGHIVPSGSPRTITAFVPSREIAFVQPGAPASVEVQSLSVSEFGLARARVSRVSADVATAAEVQNALNEALPGSFVRVELELCDSRESAKMEPLLRSGERVKIRLHRRQQRLITLLFDFVQRWVQ
jgi:multidrug resistance efflux pump